MNRLNGFFVPDDANVVPDGANKRFLRPKGMKEMEPSLEGIENQVKNPKIPGSEEKCPVNTPNGKATNSLPISVDYNQNETQPPNDTAGSS